MTTQVAGRGTDQRTIASVVSTNAVATITAPAGSFDASDVGRTITHSGFGAGRKILSVQSGTAATVDGNATSGATATATLGDGVPDAYGFVGWSPETRRLTELYTLAGGAGVGAPSILANSVTPVPLFIK